MRVFEFELYTNTWPNYLYIYAFDWRILQPSDVCVAETMRTLILTTHTHRIETSFSRPFGISFKFLSFSSYGSMFGWYEFGALTHYSVDKLPVYWLNLFFFDRLFFRTSVNNLDDITRDKENTYNECRNIFFRMQMISFAFDGVHWEINELNQWILKTIISIVTFINWINFYILRSAESSISFIGAYQIGF